MPLPQGRARRRRPEPLQAKRLVAIETPMGAGPKSKAASLPDRESLAVARAVVPDAQEARLLAVCPAGVDVGAGFDGVLVAGDIVGAFA